MPTWRKIRGYPSYDINEFGEIRSWRKKPCSWRHPDRIKGRRQKPKPLTGCIIKHGYKKYTLRDKNGVKQQLLCHRLVAFSFLGNPPSPHHTDVAHNDGNPSNNHVSNLRWATHLDNQMDMRRHGTMQDGERCITCKLTKDQVIEIKNTPLKYGTGIVLAEKFGISTAQVSRIRSSTRWVHLDN